MRTSRLDSRTRVVAGFLLAGMAAGCAHQPGATRHPGRLLAPDVDSITVALWRFDEVAGSQVRESARGLDGTAGLDTGVEFGRFGHARSFTPSVNSFVVVPESPLLNPGRSFTVEAWLWPRSYPESQHAALVAHMADAGNQRSFLLSLTGSGPAPGDRPGHPLFSSDPTLQSAGPGRLWFAFVPQGAWSGLYSFLSSGIVALGRWTHVAVTSDGAVVRFYLDGKLDSQHAASGAPVPVALPLVIGNYLDAGYFSDFSGELRVDPAQTPPYFYPYDGLMDELRISSAARERFGGSGRP